MGIKHISNDTLLQSEINGEFERAHQFYKIKAIVVKVGIALENGNNEGAEKLYNNASTALEELIATSKNAGDFDMAHKSKILLNEVTLKYEKMQKRK